MVLLSSKSLKGNERKRCAHQKCPMTSESKIFMGYVLMPRASISSTSRKLNVTASSGTAKSTDFAVLTC